MTWPRATWRSALAAALLVVCLLVAGLLAFLVSDTGKRWTIDRIAQAVADQGFVFQAKNINYRLFSPRVTLEEVRLSEKTGAPLLNAARVDVDIDGRSLDVIVTRPRLDVVVDDLPELPKSESSGESSIKLRSIRLIDAALHARDKAGTMGLELERWQASANLLDGGRYSASLSTSQPGRLRYQERNDSIDSLRLTYSGTKVETFELVTGLGRLDASGAVEPALDLNINADTDLAKLVADLRGDASAKLHVTGTIAKPLIAGDVTASRLFWQGQGGVNASTHFTLNEALDRVALTGLRADWRGASMGGSAEIGRTGRSRADLRLAGLDSKELETLLKQKFPVATKISGNVSASWPGPDGVAEAVGRASVQFSAWPGSLDLTADAASIKVNTTGIGPSDAAVLQADVAMNRRSRELSGTLQVDSPNAGAAARLAMPDDPPAVSGAVSANASLSGTLALPEADFQLSSPGLKTPDSPAASLNASGHATLEQVRVDTFEAKSGEARITATGQADITEGGTALRFDGSLDQTPLSAFTKLAEGAVSGVFSVRGTAKQPEAVARVTARGLKAYGEVLGDGRGELRYGPGGATVPNFQLTKGEGSITATASLANHQAEATIQNYTIDSLEITEGQIVSGIVNGKASFAGESLEAGTGALELAITQLAAAGRQPGRLDLAAALAQGTVKGTVKVPEWGIDSRIESAVLTPYAATIDATLRDFAIEKAVPSVTGLASGSLRASADLADLDTTLRGDAEITALRFKSGGEEAASTGPIKIHYAGGLADIESATLVSGDSRVTARGQVPVQSGQANLTLDADIDVALAARLATLDPALAPAGRLRARGTVAGAAPDWKPDVTVELTGGSINPPGVKAPLTNVQATIAAREGIVKLTEATAAWLGGALRVTGEAPLAATSYQLRAEATGLRLEQLQSGSQLAGVVNLRAEAEGKGLTVRDVVAKLEAPGLRLQMGELDLTATSTPTVTVRDGLVQIRDFELTGAGTRFQIRGGTALVDPYPLAVRVDGDLDAALVGLFTTELSAQGAAKVQLALTGTTETPRFGGSIELSDAQATIPRAGAVLEKLHARADLLGQQITLSDVTGTLNGGTFTGGGTAELTNGALGNVAITLQSKNSAWNIPEGLETAANIDLKLEGNRQGLSLSGDVEVLEGSYRERMVIERGLLNALQPSAASAAAASGASGQTPINLNVRVHTASPILVANDLLNGALNADVRVRGTPQRPGLTGRVNLDEGGTLYLGGRNYLAERATVTFTNERKIEPVLDVLAQTRAGGREITLQARGTVGGDKLETTFTSDDGLPESDVIALLVTGRTLRETRGAEIDIASDQALSYLSGSIGSTVSARASQALGFKLVRIDPSLIAQEAEPTARLTLGQDLSDRVGLVYSVNLKNSTDQIWIGRVDVTPRFSARVVRQSDNSYRLQFQHDLEFGGEAPVKRKRSSGAQLRVGTVSISGNSPVPEAKVRKRFGLRTGKPYDFFQFRKGIDKVKESLTAEGYPEASVKAERSTPSPGVVDLQVSIEAGAPVQFVFEGGGVSRSARRQVEKAWSANSFDSLRSRQSKAVLLERLVGRGYYEATVDPSVRDNPDGTKRVLFEVTRGTRHKKLEFAFPGASEEHVASLRELFREKQARLDAILKPEQAREQVAAYYRGNGYLEAQAKTRVLEKTDAGRMRFALPVVEGERYRVGKIEVAGAAESAAPLATGNPYTPAEADRAAERIAESLESKGFTAAETTIAVTPDTATKTVDLKYQVTPGEKQVLGEVEVTGNRFISENLVRSQVDMKPGEPITSHKLSVARRNLYDTGAFASTELELQPGDRNPGGVSTRLVARVREVRPYELRYGGLFDTENGVGGIVDFSARNVLGAARVVGFRGRYDGILREARTYFEQPNLLRFPMKWVTTGFVRREISEGFLTDRTGGSTTAEFRWRRFYRLNAGYRFEQVHTFEKVPDPIFPFDIRLRIAPLVAGFQRDTRNDILDTRTGSFFSHIAEWAPEKLGSQLQYAKYFGQYFHYRPMLGERRFANAPSRPGLVLAAGGRFGIAAGLGGQDLIVSERFFSGGGTSVRGFAQDRLGTLPGRTPVGGEAIWITNVEARIPLFKYADIVSFIDGGNVYRRWRDLSLSDARFSVGLGVRIRTPYVLLRLDYGIKLNRREGESFGRLFGGIGQAF